MLASLIVSSPIEFEASLISRVFPSDYIKNKWNPVAKTSEALVEMFERRPEQGKHVRHRKVSLFLDLRRIH